MIPSHPKGFGPERPSEPNGLAVASAEEVPPLVLPPGEGAEVEAVEGDAGLPEAEGEGEAKGRGNGREEGERGKGMKGRERMEEEERV